MSKFYRINNGITAPEVRVLAGDGSQIGLMPLAEAKAKAAELGVDLVEINGAATPPVVKLINYKKLRYQEEKKEREARKGTKKVEMKEFWLGPQIGEHDLLTRVNRGIEYLKGGDHVRFTVRFSGREMAHKEFGFRVLDRVKELVKEVGEVEKEPFLLGRELFITFKPK